MPPKVKVTKEEILRAAVALVRKNGAEALGSRALAAELGCSTQPIFSNFSGMEELVLAVLKEADALFRAFSKKETDEGRYPPYKASGMAYIRFAKEEKNLFCFLYMRDRGAEAEPEEKAFDEQTEALVQSQTGLSKEQAQLFHMEMWAFVHGIAAMLATGFLELEEEFISRMLTDAYFGLRKQFSEEENHGCH